MRQDITAEKMFLSVQLSKLESRSLRSVRMTDTVFTLSNTELAVNTRLSPCTGVVRGTQCTNSFLLNVILLLSFQWN